MTLAAAKALAERIISDIKPFLDSAPDLDAFGESALNEHQGDYPLVSAPEVTSAGRTFDLSTLPEYDPGTSEIMKVEYPTVEDDGDPEGMDEDEWTIVLRPAGEMIVFADDSIPPAGKSMRLHITTPHPTDGSRLNTLEVTALAWLIATHLAEKLSSRMAMSLDPALPADAVSFGDKPTIFAELSDRWRKRYRSIMASQKAEEEDEESSSVSTKADWDVSLQSGRPPLFHRERGRR